MNELNCGIYKHYKGGLYLVLGLGQHSENEELFVVHVSLTGANLPGPRLRVRPLSLWTDRVRGEPRFTYVGHETTDEVLNPHQV